MAIGVDKTRPPLQATAMVSVRMPLPLRSRPHALKGRCRKIVENDNLLAVPECHTNYRTPHHLSAGYSTKAAHRSFVMA